MTHDSPPTTLVIQTAFLGDVVLTTPLLSALAAIDGPVDVVTTPAAAVLLEHHPAVRQVIGYDKRGVDRGLGGLWRLGRRLREHHYARIVLPHRSWRSAALAMIAGTRERIGFADSPAARSYTRRVVRLPDGVHETKRLLALAGPDAPSEPVSLGLTASDYAAADRWLAERQIAPGFIAMAPGSIWGTKRWPGYPALARLTDRPMVVIGSAADAPLGEMIAAGAPERAHNACGALPLRTSAALIERAALLVTNDSAPLHLATAVGTPIVAIFGPTVPAFGFGPLSPHDRVVEIELDCRPCSRHGPQVCPLGHHRCMRDLSAIAVAQAVDEVLEHTTAHHSRLTTHDQ